MDVKGKRVAVVGTGATGVQITQEVCPTSCFQPPSLKNQADYSAIISGLPKSAKKATLVCSNARRTSPAR